MIKTPRFLFLEDVKLFLNRETPTEESLQKVPKLHDSAGHSSAELRSSTEIRENDQPRLAVDINCASNCNGLTCFFFFFAIRFFLPHFKDPAWVALYTLCY